MLNPDPTAALRRRKQRDEALKRISPTVGCVLCGETRPFALHTRQGHHVAGRNNQSLAAHICLNDHALTHESMRSLGVRLSYEGTPSPIERLVALLASLGQLLVSAGGVLIEWAVWLTEVGNSITLDALPDWTPGVTS